MSEVPLHIILPRARRGYVILDEGHKIRNPDAEVTQVSLHPKPYTRLSDPQTLYLSSTQTLHPYPDLLNPKPYTCLEPKPYTLTQTVRPENRNPSRKKINVNPTPYTQLQAVKQLNTPHRLILSGAPIQNKLRELW